MSYGLFIIAFLEIRVHTKIFWEKYTFFSRYRELSLLEKLFCSLRVQKISLAYTSKKKWLDRTKTTFSSGRFNLFHLHDISQVFSNLKKKVISPIFFELGYCIMMQISEHNQSITIKHTKNLERQILVILSLNKL